MIEVTPGVFYGTCTKGGANDNGGTLFSISSNGDFHIVCQMPGTGTLPGSGLLAASPLTLGSNGNFYASSLYGSTNGSTGDGTIFTVTPQGDFSYLHIFDYPGDAGPTDPLLLAADGNFYGTASFGGSNNLGTVFKITPAGQFTSLYSFTGPTRSQDFEFARLTQSTEGNIYGVTENGGLGAGSIFKITTGGLVYVMYDFPTNVGFGPFGSLVAPVFFMGRLIKEASAD
jgi:uncharacterized repeat protein (TIGR03803 family)